MLGQSASEVDQVRICIKTQGTLKEGNISPIAPLPTAIMSLLVEWTWQSHALPRILMRSGWFQGLERGYSSLFLTVLPECPP